MNTVQKLFVIFTIVAVSQAQKISRDPCARCSSYDQEIFSEIEGTLPSLNLAKRAPFKVNGVDYFEAALAYNKNPADEAAAELLKSNAVTRRVLNEFYEKLEEMEEEVQEFKAKFVEIGSGCGTCVALNEMIEDLNRTNIGLRALNTVLDLAKKLR